MSTGMYQFPFRLNLPANLPESVAFKYKDFEAEVTYSLYAIVNPQKRANVKPLTTTLNFEIRNRNQDLKEGLTFSG